MICNIIAASDSLSVRYHTDLLSMVVIALQHSQWFTNGALTLADYSILIIDAWVLTCLENDWKQLINYKRKL